MSDSDTAIELTALRNALDEVDAQLVRNIAERQRIVGQIGTAKSAVGQQTRDFARERVVLERVARHAETEGLDPDVAVGVLQLLIQSSLEHQEKARLRSADAGDGKRALVIGGAGRMGRWFAEFLYSQSFVVSIADPSSDLTQSNCYENLESAGVDFDVIVVATTLATSAKILDRLAELRPRGLIFDIGSLKSPLKLALQRLADRGVSVTSVHPMFGPNTQLLAERQVIFVDAGNAEATDAAVALFEQTMATCVRMSIEEHDRLIAFVLGVSHVANIAFVNALRTSGIPAEQLLAMSSPTYDAQLRMGNTVVNENPDLYYEIQSMNQYGEDARHIYGEAVATILRAVTNGEQDVFVRIMRSSREFMSVRDRE